MGLSFVLPSSTSNANRSLKLICNQALSLGTDCFLSDTLVQGKINITYGYLGLFSEAVCSRYLQTQSPVFRSSYILDHAFAPPELKGKVFRLASMNSSLSPVLFNERFITSSDLDKIYVYLKKLASEVSVSLSISNYFKCISDHSFSLLIKSSPVLSRLLPHNHHNVVTNEWLKQHILFENNSGESHKKFGLISLKRNEVYLTPYGKVRSRNALCIAHQFDYKSIKSVCCPTSMFALSFILHSIPVRLSDSHPLFRLLGGYIPSLSTSDALELIMNVIMRTSLSTECFPKLANYLEGYTYPVY